MRSPTVSCARSAARLCAAFALLAIVSGIAQADTDTDGGASEAPATSGAATQPCDDDPFLAEDPFDEDDAFVMDDPFSEAETTAEAESATDDDPFTEPSSNDDPAIDIASDEGAASEQDEPFDEEAAFEEEDPFIEEDTDRVADSAFGEVPLSEAGLGSFFGSPGDLPIQEEWPRRDSETLIEGIAAQVGSGVVLVSEVSRLSAPVEERMRDAGAATSEIMRVRTEALERLIESRLIEDVVRRAQLSVTEAEVNQAVAAIAGEKGQ